MSHIISLKVTKFQQPLLIALGIADENPEGAKRPPPRDIGLIKVTTIEINKVGLITITVFSVYDINYQN